MKELLKKNPLAARAIRVVRARQSELKARLGLMERVAELEARMSVVDGRSLLNAERNIRTHASLQNLAEDLEADARRVRLLMAERAQAQQTDDEEE